VTAVSADGRFREAAMVFGFIKRAVERFKKGLSKTRGLFSGVFGRRLDEEMIDMLEEALISADVGFELSTALIDEVREGYRAKRLRTVEDVFDALKERIHSILADGPSSTLVEAPEPPTVYLFAGVNGTGKTTSIAKLAHHFVRGGRSVVVAACDTFRAAAAEQLEKWCDRIQERAPNDVFCRLVRAQPGADPAAVAYDAIEAARARRAHVVIVDTAGRLHTKTPLMEELRKIVRVIGNRIPGAPHESIIVMDATTGQNGIAQARTFKEAVTITGIFLAKLDGTAKGGTVVAIARQLGIPVKMIGVGEGLEDMEFFDAGSFVEALLGEGK